jgi:hypothetical protein
MEKIMEEEDFYIQILIYVNIATGIAFGNILANFLYANYFAK